MPCGINLCYLRTNNSFLEFLKNFESLPWCHLKDMWRTGGVIILTVSLQFLLSPVTVTQGSFEPSGAALSLSSSSTGEREDRCEGQVLESSCQHPDIVKLDGALLVTDPPHAYFTPMQNPFFNNIHLSITFTFEPMMQFLKFKLYLKCTGRGIFCKLFCFLSLLSHDSWVHSKILEKDILLLAEIWQFL